MEKQPSKQLHFKPDHRDNSWLFPPTIGELVPLGHPVRFIDQVIDQMDLTNILSSYKPGGTSIYHPRVLVKLLVFGYLNRTYSSRRLERELHENICYMWLCGMNKPDHVTISNFRSVKLKGQVKNLLSQVVKELYDRELIKLETQVVDGTKFESVANRYTYVWAKNIARFKGNIEQKIEVLLAEAESQIEEDDHTKISSDKDNHRRDTASNDKQANQTQDQVTTHSERIEKKLTELENVETQNVKKKVKEIKKKHLPKLKSYEQKQEILNGRNSFSKTDPDATFMRMKDDRLGTGQLKAAYNIQLSSEQQFIINYTVHQNANDATCYISHTDDTLEMLRTKGLPLFDRANGDSIYGTEENYEYLQDHQIDNYLKYPSYHSDLKPNNKKFPFHSRTLYYHKEGDYYVCPMGQKMHVIKVETRQRKSGYEAEQKIYGDQNCNGCPLRGQCTKGQAGRTVTRNPNLEKHKTIAKENLGSELGQQLRSNRSVDVEPIFGHIKYNRMFNRLMLRSIPKVEVELGLHAIAHNLKKMLNKLSNQEKGLDISKNHRLNVLLNFWEIITSTVKLLHTNLSLRLVLSYH